MPNNLFDDRLLTAKEAAEYLGLAEGTIRNKASRDEVPHIKLGAGPNAPLRFRKSELDHWIIQKQAEHEESAA